MNVGLGPTRKEIRRRGGRKECTGEKEGTEGEGTEERRGEGGHRALFGDILDALSQGLEVFSGTCREGVVLMEAVATSFVTVEDLSC